MIFLKVNYLRKDDRIGLSTIYTTVLPYESSFKEKGPVPEKKQDQPLLVWCTFLNNFLSIHPSMKSKKERGSYFIMISFFVWRKVLLLSKGTALSL